MSYRQVSNLCFVHQFLELFVFNQMDIEFTQFPFHSKFQSANNRNHSTETALLRVRTDILEAKNVHAQVILVLLDLMAAIV